MSYRTEAKTEITAVLSRAQEILANSNTKILTIFLDEVSDLEMLTNFAL